MDSPKTEYNVLITGIHSDVPRDKVIAAAEELFHWDRSVILSLLDKLPYVIKRNADLETATKHRNRLVEAGFICNALNSEEELEDFLRPIELVDIANKTKAPPVIKPEPAMTEVINVGSGYVASNLMPGEQVVCIAIVSSAIYLRSVVGLLVSILMIGSSQLIELGAFIFLVSIASFIKAIITRNTTELAVTTKRIIAKFGFIRRSTIELNHNKVESLQIKQGVFGRLFDYGTLIINGSGGGKTPIPQINNPLAFRKKAMLEIDRHQK